MKQKVINALGESIAKQITKINADPKGMDELVRASKGQGASPAMTKWLAGIVLGLAAIYDDERKNKGVFH